MQIVYDYPPNYEEIAKTFNIEGRTNIVYAYGDKLFVPGGKNVDIDKHLLVHEETHQWQQNDIGVEEWWDKYLKDSSFRFIQEVEAYRNQYRSMGVLSLQSRLAYLDHMATDLSGEMYGNLVSKEDAMRVITDGIILSRPKKPGKKNLSMRQLKKRARQNKKKGRR